jgi:hypothetical protein
MSPKVRVRYRLNIVLQMVTTLITAILLGQLWLFTIMLDAMENGAAPPTLAAGATICSLLASCAIWMLIRFFLRTEQWETEKGE